MLLQQFVCSIGTSVKYKNDFNFLVGLFPEQRCAAVYHAFFDIDSLAYDCVYCPSIPIFFGLFEDNDPNGRLLSVANHNNDIGDTWEWADSAWVPISLSNEMFKLGVNYIMYSLTH